MHLSNTSILSLSLSTNRLGFGVFRNGQLDYYGGRTLNRYRTTRDRNRGVALILDELSQAHCVGKVALPKLNKQQRHSPELRSLYIAIQRSCAKNGLPVIMQDPVQIRQQIAGADKPSKAKVLTRLIEIFPELKRYSTSGSEWERRYYGHIFTAIASGIVAADARSAAAVRA